MSYTNPAEMAFNQPPVMDLIMKNIYDGENEKISMLHILQVFKSTPVENVIHKYIDKHKHDKINEIGRLLSFEKQMHALFDKIDDVDETGLSAYESEQLRTQFRFDLITYALNNVDMLFKQNHNSFKYACFWAIRDLANSGQLNDDMKRKYTEDLGLESLELHTF